MKFQIGTDGTHPFLHGQFFNEHGPYFRGEGLEHLSKDNFFCQQDALAFIQESLASGKITLEEAMVLEKDEALLSLPEEYPPDLAEYERNQKALVWVMMQKSKICLQQIKKLWRE